MGTMQQHPLAVSPPLEEVTNSPRGSTALIALDSTSRFPLLKSKKYLTGERIESRGKSL
jgi:hypothetical protein